MEVERCGGLYPPSTPLQDFTEDKEAEEEMKFVAADNVFLSFLCLFFLYFLPLFFFL